MANAGALMQTRVHSVTPETGLLEVCKLLARERIGAAPVVDEEDNLRGVVSASDLVRWVGREHERVGRVSAFEELSPYLEPDWDSFSGEFGDLLRDGRARDVMTGPVFTVAAGAATATVARIMREHRVHRVFVVEQRQLLGVVTSFDLLRLVELGSAAPGPVSSPPSQ